MKSLSTFLLQRRGYLFALLAAVTYGMNPLFALPLYAEGFDADSVLFFRYAPAALVLFVMTLMKHESVRLTKTEFAGTFALGMLFSCSSLFLFLSYLRMDAGVASTLLFVYPVMVAFIMAFCFHEKITFRTGVSIALSFMGIALLCRTADGGFRSVTGIVFVMLSSLSYALYLVAVNRWKALKTMPAVKLTFYVIAFGILLYLIRLKFGFALKGHFSLWAWMNIAGLALVSTVISMVCTNLAVQKAGATPTAIFGALEPVTAVFFGVVVFHERLTVRIAFGIFLILSSVILILLKKTDRG